MAKVGGWGTYAVVYSNGAAYSTTNINWGNGLWGDNMLQTGWLNGKPAYGVSVCHLRVFIRCYNPFPEARS